MRKHAILSASAASRWINCTPSARLTEDIEDTSSIFAKEGTLAHELGELMLNHALKNIDKRNYNREYKKIQEHELYAADMTDYVQSYVDHVLERYAEAKSKTKDALIYLEQRLDFSDWVPEGFGTGDVVIISDGAIEIIDLKYGKGVEVSADHNYQMMLYGLGAYNEYEAFYDLDKVKMTIIQPRLDHISTYELDTDALLDWADNICRPAAEKAWDGQGDLVAGEHCRFCKVKAGCKARAKVNLDFIDQYEKDKGFNHPDMLSAEDVSAILSRTAEIKNWLSDIEEDALAKALAGSTIPGFKIVEGRSNRVIVDPDLVAGELCLVYSEEQVFNKKLKGITDLEKLVGKKNFSAQYGQYVEKPQGKPTLVPESDKRPVFDSASADFNIE